MALRVSAAGSFGRLGSTVKTCCKHLALPFECKLLLSCASRTTSHGRRPGDLRNSCHTFPRFVLRNSHSSFHCGRSSRRRSGSWRTARMKRTRCFPETSIDTGGNCAVEGPAKGLTWDLSMLSPDVDENPKILVFNHFKPSIVLSHSPACFTSLFHLLFPNSVSYIMGSSAQISSGVCRCGSQEQVPEEGSGKFRRVLV